MAKKAPVKKTPVKKTPAIDVGEFLKSAKAISAPLGSVDALSDVLGIKGPLLLLGSEELRIKRLIAWIVETLLPADTSVVRHYGGQITSKTKVQELKAELSSNSLFAVNQVHIIFNIDQIKVAQFVELEAALQHGFVILTSTLEQKKGSAVEKLSRFTGVKLDALSGESLVRWIAKEASELGAGGIEPAAAQLLARCFEGNLDRLHTELSMLSLLVSSDKPISLDLVQQHSQASIEKTSFDLLEAISKKDLPAAQFLTRKLQTQGSHPLQLCAFLAKCYRVMAANQQTLSGGPTSSSSELGNKWFINKLQPIMRRLGAKETLGSLLVLKQLDEELKGSQLSEQSVIQLAMQKLTLRTM